MAIIEDGKRWVRQQSVPLTLGIMAALVVGSVLTFFTRWFPNLFIFNAGDALQRPWSVLTYPLVNPALGDPIRLIFFIFLLMWTFWVGGFLEREAGTRKAALFWLGMTVLPALLLWGGMQIARGGVPVFGPDLAIWAATVYWGVRNKEGRILLFAVLPIKGLYLAMIAVLGTFLEYAGTIWWLGFFACAHTGLASWLAEKGVLRSPAIPKKTKVQIEREEKFEEEVRSRKREREEMERLRRLLEGPTGGDDR